MIFVKYQLPDNKNNIDDVVLGFDNIADYIENANTHNFGSTLGRVASRISNSTYSIDDKIYYLDKNDGYGHDDGKDPKVRLKQNINQQKLRRNLNLIQNI